MDLRQVAASARRASRVLAGVSVESRNAVLVRFREELLNRRDHIEAENLKDIQEAQTGGEDLVKRLKCSGDKFDALLEGLQGVISLEDPVGKCDMHTELSRGLDLYRLTCPIGVVAVIFEARPEAAVQIASLAIKSSNSLILKGGKEARRSNIAVYEAIRAACTSVSGFPEDAVQLVNTREDVRALLQFDQDIDLVIPRGSNALVRYVKDNTRVPVLGHADGICAVYVDKSVEESLDQAVRIVEDSKTDYPAACNALETLLVHKAIASEFLPRLAQKLETHGVRFKADELSSRWLPKDRTELANSDDFRREFLSLVMAVKCVDSTQEAINHINANGSGHTDCIITDDPIESEKFQRLIDSAGVYWNASTRFADGFRYGFGAEVGISTNRIHARGPVGLEGLVIHKYRLYGSGQVAGEFGPGKPHAFTHKKHIGTTTNLYQVQKRHGQLL